MTEDNGVWNRNGRIPNSSQANREEVHAGQIYAARELILAWGELASDFLNWIAPSVQKASHERLLSLGRNTLFREGPGIEVKEC